MLPEQDILMVGTMKNQSWSLIIDTMNLEKKSCTLPKISDFAENLGTLCPKISDFAQKLGILPKIWVFCPNFRQSPKNSPTRLIGPKYGKVTKV